VKREHERRLTSLTVQARRAALSLGVVILCLGAVLTIASAEDTGSIAGLGVLATGAGLLRFAGSTP
jgi:hypothetical protein